MGAARFNWTCVLLALCLFAIPATTATADEDAPVNVATPTVAGSLQQGARLTASSGSWSEEPDTVSFAWLRCDDAGESCTPLAGADDPVYQLTSDDVQSTVRVRVTATNSAGSTQAESTATAPISAPDGYAQAVRATSGLEHFWRLGERSGTVLADEVAASDATASGVGLGVAGALTGGSDTAAHFDGQASFAHAPIDLSHTSQLTVEFWLNWAAYANDDRLAMEFTPNNNDFQGGFVVIPNNGQGDFAISVGNGAARNTVRFPRPSAGEWHHYALVLDTTASGGSQIVPYVDGRRVDFTVAAGGTGAGAFGDSTLFFMSRDASSLFGTGDLDELALYSATLTAGTIREHYRARTDTLHARLRTRPTRPSVGHEVTFDASDSDGSIATYEWDFDSDGVFEASSESPTITHTFTSSGMHTIALRVTSPLGATDAVAQDVDVRATGDPYADAVFATGALEHFWRLGEASGSVAVDEFGTSDAATGGVDLGVAGALANSDDTAAHFDGHSAFARARLDLSHTSRLTVEFWLNWTSYADDDRVAMEFTPDNSSFPGGFVVIPNDYHGDFAVTVGRDDSRNTVRFARPSAGQWHHYAIVLDTTAPANEQVQPYVDGQRVAKTLEAGGTEAGAFGDSTLFFMSRNASSLFGAGDLDELALYSDTLPAYTIRQHYRARTDVPKADLRVQPTRPGVGQEVVFDAFDSDGSIAEYEWDLNGDGTFESATEDPFITHTFMSTGTHTVRLRVTSTSGAASTLARDIEVSATTDAYAEAVLATNGLEHFWRLGESTGTLLADEVGTSDAMATGVGLGATGALGAGRDAAAHFDGIAAFARAPVDLSHTSQLTVEFWLNWTSYGDDDRLAMEFTPNNNVFPGGFVVIPNESGGEFAISVGREEARNTVAFARPSAGQWHHYAIVLDTTQAGGSQIVPYVDGRPVDFSVEAAGTGAGPFASSTLFFMSRNASSLFGTGELDELALYSQTLDPETILAHARRDPAIAEQSVTDLDLHGATLNAGLNPGGAATSYWFEWGRTQEYGRTTAEDDAGDSSSEVTVSASVDGLRAGRTYHYRLVAQQGTDEPILGEDHTFTTHASAPTVAAVPRVSGVPSVYEPLRASTGSWTGDAPFEYRYQWQRCDGSGSSCVDIEDAIDRIYTLGDDDEGSTVRVQVRASSGDVVSLAAASAATAVVIPDAPWNEEPPTISGRPIEGTTLHAAPGTWWPEDDPAFAWLWLRCDPAGGACAEISDATASTYVPEADDVGSTLRVRVTTTNAGGTTSETSSPTWKIASATAVPNLTPPSLSLRHTFDGDRLVADTGTWDSPSPPNFVYAWQRCNADGDACVELQARGSSLDLRSSDEGSTLRVVVTAIAGGGSTSATSAESEVIDGGIPVVEEVPVVEGTAQVDGLLAGSDGTYAGTGPIEVTHRWQRCDAAGEDCADIAGADDSLYRPSVEDLASTLRLVVTVSNSHGASIAASAVTELVAPAPAPFNPDATGPEVVGTAGPALSGETLVGATLTVSPGLWIGTGPLTYSYSWERCDAGEALCDSIEDADGATYMLTSDDAGEFIRVIVTVDDATSSNSVVARVWQSVRTAGGAANVAAPAVSGDAVEGSPLSASAGTWDGGEPLVFSYQWESCDLDGEECSDIDLATAPTFVPGADEAGTALRITVTATGSGGETSARSALTDEVTRLSPWNTDLPTATGELRLGHVLTAEPGTWEGAEPITFAYRWQTCDQDGECEDISGADGQAHTLTAAEIDETVRVVVMASNATGEGDAMWESDQPVSGADAPHLETRPVVEGAARERNPLSASTGSWSGPGSIAYTYQWQICEPAGETCDDIVDATEAQYTPERVDTGWAIRVRVAATNASGTVTASSELSDPVSPADLGDLTPVVNTALPVVTGSLRSGRELSASAGAWSGGDSLTYRYVWRRCDADGRHCASIADASAATYISSSEDTGSTFRVVVSASNGWSTRSVSSEATEPITASGTAPENVEAPQVWGNPAQDDVLEGYVGEWAGDTPTFELQWQRCDSEDSCVNIAGAVAETYALRAADLGSTIRLSVTATNEDGEATAVSDPTEPVGPPVPAAPNGDYPPRIQSLGANDGQDVNADPGYWDGNGELTFAYQWQRCDVDGEDCADLPGATENYYVLTSADLGARVRFRVTGSNANGSASAVSEPTDVVVGGDPEISYLPEIMGVAEPGGELEVWSGDWSGSVPNTFTYQWRRCDLDGENCADIDGATTSTRIVSDDDRGRVLRVSVTASNAHGTSSATSHPMTIPAPLAENVEAPSITGTGIVGKPLTATVGTWSGSIEDRHTAWQRCQIADICTNIQGASGDSYVVREADLGSRIRFVVRAVSGETIGAAVASAPTSEISTSSDASWLAQRVDPYVEGELRVGETLRVFHGGWAGATPINYSYAWYRCSTQLLNSCTWIGSGSEYRLEDSESNKRIRVQVEVFNSSGAYDSTSTPFTGLVSPAAPRSLSPPTLLGDPVAGSQLSYQEGEWAPSGYASIQWQRCAADGNECLDIPGATMSAFTPSRPDIGSTFRVQISQSNAEGTATATSETSGVVVAADPPANEELPTIDGIAEVDGQLMADVGEWSGSQELQFDYTWQRCDVLGDDCTDVLDWQYYIVRRADAGHRIRLLVSATNGARTISVASELTAVVASAPPIANVEPPSLTWWWNPHFGTAVPVNAGVWSGDPETIERRWQRCDPAETDLATGQMPCEDIPGAVPTTGEYLPAVEDIGYHLRVKETATAPEQTETAYSAITAEPVRGDAGYVSAEMTGTMIVGQTIRANAAYHVEPELPTTVTYEFVRDNSGPGTTTLQSGADPNYVLQPDDLHHFVSVKITTTVERPDHRTVISSDERSLSGEYVYGPPTATVNPSISGDALVGATLTATRGTWQEGGALTFSYQWQTCDPAGEACADLPGVTSPRYRLADQDSGTTVRVRVRAANGSAHTVAISSPTTVITAPDDPIPPVDIPTITGQPVAFSPLVAHAADTPGRVPASIAYQWEYCDADQPQCAEIEGATHETFVPSDAFSESRVRVRVIAAFETGTEAGTSALTAPIQDALQPANLEMPTLSALGHFNAGTIIVTDGGTWSNLDDADIGYQWQRCTDICVDIAGANERAYELSDDDVGTRVQVEASAENSSGVALGASERSPIVGERQTGLVDRGVAVATDRKTLLVTDADGENAQPLVNCITLVNGLNAEGCGLSNPAIAPNAQMIAVEVRSQESDPSTAKIVLVNYDGTEPRTLISGEDPAWALDGTGVLFTDTTPDGSGRTRIARVAADGSQQVPTPVISGAGSSASPDISPDARYLTYAGRETTSSNWGIYVAAADGSRASRLRLGSEIRQAFRPRFSFDGRKILFTATTPDSVEGDPSRSIWEINRDGSGLTQRVDLEGENDVAPLPDDHILFWHRAVDVINYGWGTGFEYGEYETYAVDILDLAHYIVHSFPFVDYSQYRPLMTDTVVEDIAHETGLVALEATLRKAQTAARSTADAGLTSQVTRTLGQRAKQGVKASGLMAVIGILAYPDESACELGPYKREVGAANRSVGDVVLEAARARVLTVSATLPGRIATAQRDLDKAADSSYRLRDAVGDNCNELPWQFSEFVPYLNGALRKAKDRAEVLNARRPILEAALATSEANPETPKVSCRDSKGHLRKDDPRFLVYWRIPPRGTIHTEQEVAAIDYIGITRNLTSRCNVYKRQGAENSSLRRSSRKNAGQLADWAKGRYEKLQTLRLPYLDDEDRANDVEEALIAHFGPMGLGWTKDPPRYERATQGHRRGQRGQLTNVIHAVRDPDAETYCPRLLYGQYILVVSREYARYAQAYFTEGKDCLGTGKDPLDRS